MKIDRLIGILSLRFREEQSIAISRIFAKLEFLYRHLRAQGAVSALWRVTD